MTSTSNPGILLIGNFLSRTLGTRCVCEDLAERLDSTGWFRVLTTSGKAGRVSRLLDMMFTVWRRQSEYGVAQVDVYSGPAFIWAEIVCRNLRLRGKKYILTLHGGNLPQFGEKHPERVKRLLNSAAVVTTPSHYLLEQMRGYRADLKLLPNPLDLGAYEFRLRERPAPRLMWLRAFHTIYNPQLAARVLGRLSAEWPEAHLTMVGPDKNEGSMAELKRVAAELGVTARIDLPGPVPKSDVPQWMERGDIFLNTTNVDNAPVSVIEAMACGLCVVNTSVGGIPYLLKDGHDALLVPPDDPEAMVAAVKRILTEPGLAAKLSRNARAKAEQFDWSVVLPQWETLFRTLLKS